MKLIIGELKEVIHGYSLRGKKEGDGNRVKVSH